METCPRVRNSSELNEELLAGLRSFLKLFDRRRDVFQEAAECLRRAGGVDPEASACRLTVALLGLFGGGIGAVAGGISGGLWGVFGAVGAATYSRICGHVNAVDASVGFIAGAFGGLVGGALSGPVGCEVEVAFVASGRPINGTVSNVLWFSFGSASGGAIGSIFGGSIGAVGGAVGGGLGALHARAVALSITAATINPSSEGKDPVKSETAEMLQTSLRSLSGCIEPLVEELQSIQRVSAQVEFSSALLSLTNQTSKTLAAVRSLEKSLSDCQEAADPPDRSSRWKEAARRSSEALEELKKMKVKVEETMKMLH